MTTELALLRRPQDGQVAQVRRASRAQRFYCRRALDCQNHEFGKLCRVGKAADVPLRILLRPGCQFGRGARAHHHLVTVFQETAAKHFCHITDNFAAGLFRCYDIVGLPRTNNDLEHCFGVARVHERRGTAPLGEVVEHGGRI